MHIITAGKSDKIRPTKLIHFANSKRDGSLVVLCGLAIYIKFFIIRYTPYRSDIKLINKAMEKLCKSVFVMSSNSTHDILISLIDSQNPNFSELNLDHFCPVGTVP